MLVGTEIKEGRVSERLHLGQVGGDFGTHVSECTRIHGAGGTIRIVEHTMFDGEQCGRGAGGPDLVEYEPHNQHAQTDADDAITRRRDSGWLRQSRRDP